MRIGSFLKLVEIQTKAASIIPFAIGTGYAVYRYDRFVTENFFLMLVSLLAIDMATTAINNYQDYKKAHVRHGFGYESHNAIVRDALGEGSVRAVIAMLLLIASAFGLLLFFKTDLTVLAIGGGSFLFAVAYSCGPVPISRTPFGELFSGGFMGFVIPFLAIHIHVPPETLAFIALDGWTLTGRMDLRETCFLLFAVMPAVTGIANIMLANNICDMEDDLQNRRFTLPILIGRKSALSLYWMLYAAGGLSLLAAVAAGALPLMALLVLLAGIPVCRNIRSFLIEQSKERTFSTAVQNFVFINTALALSLALSILFL